jgi:AAA+ lid domain
VCLAAALLPHIDACASGVFGDAPTLRKYSLGAGFSGAELSNMVNEAALVAAKQHAAHIDTAGLEFAQVTFSGFRD